MARSPAHAKHAATGMFEEACLNLVVHLPWISAIPPLRQFLVLLQRLTALDEQFGRFRGNNRIGWNRFEDHCHRTYSATFTNCDGSQQGRTNTDSDIVFDCGMALLLTPWPGTPPARCAKRDLVIEHHVIADHRCLSYHHPGAMVNEETFTDLCAWMNLNSASNKTRKLRDQAWQKRDMDLIQCMCNTMVDDSPQPLVKQRLKNIVTGRIFLKDNINSIRPSSPATWSPAGRWNKDAGRKLWQL